MNTGPEEHTDKLCYYHYAFCISYSLFAVTWLRQVFLASQFGGLDLVPGKCMEDLCWTKYHQQVGFVSEHSVFYLCSIFMCYPGMTQQSHVGPQYQGTQSHPKPRKRRNCLFIVKPFKLFLMRYLAHCFCLFVGWRNFDDWRFHLVGI
jgi:hypothetical protein